MAIYHTRVKVFSRSKGESAVAAAAYRAGISLLDKLTGIRHDYTRRNGVVANLCLAPKGAPEWAVDPTRIWEAAQDAERRKDACLAREFEISLPHELTDAKRLKLVEAIGQALVDRYGFAIQASIHAPDPDGLNHHVHILATTRRMGSDGLGAKTRELDGGAEGRKQVDWVRALVAEKINEHLKQAGLSERVDHRRLDVQALDALQHGDLEAAARLARRPTEHEGKAATAMRKRGEVSERRQINESIIRANAARFRSLMAGLAKEGRLMPTPASHSHAAAVRDRPAASPNAVEQAVLAASTKASMLKVLASHRRVRYKSGNKQDDALAVERREREDEIERLLLEAQHLWQQGLNDTLRTALVGNSAILLESKALIRQYAHRYSFFSDVRGLHQAITQADRDSSRFRRRMEAQERAEIELGAAERDLRQFDTQHPRPGLWTKREWAERRRAKATRLAHRRQECLAATKATDPSAQAGYKRKAEDSWMTLRDVGSRFAANYLPGLGGLEPARSIPEEVPIEEVEVPATSKGRRRGSQRPRPQPTTPGPRPRV